MEDISRCGICNRYFPKTLFVSIICPPNMLTSCTYCQLKRTKKVVSTINPPAARVNVRGTKEWRDKHMKRANEIVSKMIGTSYNKKLLTSKEELMKFMKSQQGVDEPESESESEEPDEEPDEEPEEVKEEAEEPEEVKEEPEEVKEEAEEPDEFEIETEQVDEPKEQEDEQEDDPDVYVSPAAESEPDETKDEPEPELIYNSPNIKNVTKEIRAEIKDFGRRVTSFLNNLDKHDSFSDKEIAFHMQEYTVISKDYDFEIQTILDGLEDNEELKENIYNQIDSIQDRNTNRVTLFFSQYT